MRFQSAGLDFNDQLVLNAEFLINHSFDSVDKEWNLYNLGVPLKGRWSRSDITKANILHWSGKLKPWVGINFYQDLYKPRKLQKQYDVGPTSF